MGYNYLESFNEDWTPARRQLYTKIGKWTDELQQQMPVYPDKTPMYLINTQIVTENHMISDSVEDLLDKDLPGMKFYLDYSRGYACLYGVPIFERLSGEPIHYFDLFQAFLDMYKTEGSRSIHKLSKRVHIKPEIIFAIKQMYHWDVREKQYDAYMQIQKNLVRQREVERTTDEHLSMSRRVRDLVISAILGKDMSDEKLKDLGQVLKTIVEWERLTLDLPTKKTESKSKEAPTVNIQNNTSAVIEKGASDTNSITDEDIQYSAEVFEILDGIMTEQQRKLDSKDDVIEIDKDKYYFEDDEDEK